MVVVEIIGKGGIDCSSIFSSLDSMIIEVLDLLFCVLSFACFCIFETKLLYCWFNWELEILCKVG